jgi:hypothetical protein
LFDQALYKNYLCLREKYYGKYLLYNPTHALFTLRNNTKPNERKLAGGTVTAQSTAEDPLKMVEKKDGNM